MRRRTKRREPRTLMSGVALVPPMIRRVLPPSSFPGRYSAESSWTGATAATISPHRPA